jgi:HK97 family phage major capsid protein
MYKRLKEIEARKAEIRQMIETNTEMSNDEIANIDKELTNLSTEERGILTKIDMLERAKSGNADAFKPVEQRNGFMGQGGLSVAEYDQMEARKSKEYRNAFFKMLQAGQGSLSVEERGVLQRGNAIGNGRNLVELRFTSATTSAGAAIPQITLDQVIEKLLVISAVYPFISKYNLKGNLKIPYENVATDAAWTAEGTVVAAGADTLGNLTLAAYDLIKTVQVSRVVEQLSIDAFEAYIVDKLFRKLMVAIENAVINGTGSTNNQPTGILNAVTWGTGNTIEYGTTGATVSSLTYDAFTQAKGALLAPYHPNAYWVMSSNTLYSGVASIKDSMGRPIFLENPQWGLSVANGEQTNYQQTAVVGRILGNPVIMSPYITDGTILLGDLRFYHFNLSVDVLIEKSYEYGFASNDVWYKGWLLADGGVSQQEAFVKVIPTP